MNMSCGTARLFDAALFRRALQDTAREQRDAKASLRPAVVKLVKSALEEAHAAAEAQLVGDGDGTGCAEALSLAEDEIIRALFDLTSQELFPAKAGEERIAVVAVGGYGRGTLAPGSDIDLLFVLPARQSERVQNIVEFILYCLWDARQKVGHATRNIDECIRLARSDNTILTAILEARYICGDEQLFARLVTDFRREIVGKGAKEFIAESWASATSAT
jgi:[protein-PII] uridylyltransferase